MNFISYFFNLIIISIIFSADATNANIVKKLNKLFLTFEINLICSN